MLSETKAGLAARRKGFIAPNVALSLLCAVLVCFPIAAFAVDFNIDIQSSVGASASNASGGGPSKRVDCGSGSCAITTADDGILEYGIAASANIVKTGTSFTITAQGESELLQGSPYVTGTGDFAATIRIYSQTATSEQFVVKTVGDLKVTWQGLIPTSAGKAKAWFGTPCPDWGLNVESDASTPSGELGPTNKTVRCVRTADPPPWFKIFEMTVEMKAAAGNKVVGENTSFNGTVTFEIKSKGKEMFKEGGDNQEALVGHALPDPIKVKVVQNDTDTPVVGVQIQFTVKDQDGNVVGNVLTAETQAPDGIASVSGITLGSVPGAYTIEAYCGQCVAGQNVTFIATAEAVRTIIEKLPGAESGDRQKDRVGTQLPIPLRVRVKDTDGTLRPGIQVNFSVTQSPASVSFSDPNPVTDEMGVASTFLTLGSVAGNYEIEAICSACTGSSANGTASPANRTASSASGPASPDDRVSMSESAAEESQKVRKDENRTRGGQFSGSGGCQAVIVAEGSVPAGDTPPSPPPTIVGCKVNSLEDVGIPMECVGDADESFTSLALCEKWDWQPHSSNESIPASHPLRTNEFKSLHTGNFEVSTDYVERFHFYDRGESRCRAGGKVKVGFATVEKVRAKSEWVARAGVRSGPYTFEATFANMDNVSDLGNLAKISVTDLDDNITIYGKNAKPWNIDAKTIGFTVYFDNIEGKLEKVRIRVDFCGSQDYRELDVQLF